MEKQQDRSSAVSWSNQGFRLVPTLAPFQRKLPHTTHVSQTLQLKCVNMLFWKLDTLLWIKGHFWFFVTFVLQRFSQFWTPFLSHSEKIWLTQSPVQKTLHQSLIHYRTHHAIHTQRFFTEQRFRTLWIIITVSSLTESKSLRHKPLSSIEGVWSHCTMGFCPLARMSICLLHSYSSVISKKFFHTIKPLTALERKHRESRRLSTTR